MTRSFRFARTLVASAVLVTAAGVALAQAAVGGVSNSNASSFAGTGGGKSVSGALNVGGGFAKADGAVMPIGNIGGAGYVKGSVGTGNLSIAGNQSTGNANGTAGAAGVVKASSIGAGGGSAGGVTGNVSGNAEAITGTRAVTGSNGLGISGGAAGASYAVGALGVYSAAPGKSGVLLATGVLTTAQTTPTLNVSQGANVITAITNEAAANGSAHVHAGDQSSFAN